MINNNIQVVLITIQNWLCSFKPFYRWHLMPFYWRVLPLFESLCDCVPKLIFYAHSSHVFEMIAGSLLGFDLNEPFMSGQRAKVVMLLLFRSSAIIFQKVLKQRDRKNIHWKFQCMNCYQPIEVGAIKAWTSDERWRFITFMQFHNDNHLFGGEKKCILIKSNLFPMDAGVARRPENASD